MKIPDERPIETVRAWLTSEASVPANVYSGILLLIEFAEAHERASDLRKELT